MGESHRWTGLSTPGTTCAWLCIEALAASTALTRPTRLQDPNVCTYPGLDGHQTEMKHLQGLSAASVEGLCLIIRVPPGAGLEERFGWRNEKRKHHEWMHGRLGPVLFGIQSFWKLEPMSTQRFHCPELVGLPCLYPVVCSASGITGRI